MTVTAKRYSADAYRIMNGEKIVGFALKMANGKWSMTDSYDNRLDGVLYENPAHVAKYFNTVSLLANKGKR